MNLVFDWGAFDSAAPLPAGPVRRGSPEHLMLFSRMLEAKLLILWPSLIRERIDLAKGTEGNDRRLIRQRFVPAMIRLALTFMRGPAPAGGAA